MLARRAILGLYAKKTLPDLQGNAKLAGPAANPPPLLFTSHTVSLHHDRDIEDVHRAMAGNVRAGGQMSSDGACKASNDV